VSRPAAVRTERPDPADVAVTAAVDATSQPVPLALRARIWAPLFALATLVAAYTGFRLPNLWAATLDTVSLQEGFHRRFLVGTVLYPLADALDYSYWLYAFIGFVVLVLMLAVLAFATLRAPLVSQRFLVIAWLLLPTGGFFFHEVGYLDQLLYLFLFASLWLLRRPGWVVAPILLTLAVLTHEIAILTVLPVFGFAVLRDQEPRRAIAMLAPPSAVAIVMLAIPAIESGAVQRLTSTLRVANFTPRADALSLFGRSQSASWDLYRPWDVFWFLVPLAVVGVAGFLLLYFLDGRPRPATGGAYPLLAAGAIGAPVLLAFAGWDEWRWAFLLVSNFLIVVWLWLGDRGRELATVQWVVVAGVLLVGLHSGLRYFDGYEPRSLRPAEVRELRTQIDDGTLFDIPTR
jgi:hypothetical protein